MGPRGRVTAFAAVVGAVLALGAALAPSGVARAAQGTSPPVVQDFVQSRLLDRLEDMYGPRPEAPGTEFAGTTPGPIVQVFLFTEDSRAGRDTADPRVPREEWVVPIASGSQPLGAAVVAGEPGTPDVHLDAYIPDPGLGAGVASLGPTAALVHDPQTSSWFALDSSTVFPIVSGTSGVVSARPLDRMDLDRTSPRVDPVNPGTIGALVAFVGLVAVGLLSLAIPRLLRRRLDPGEPDPRLARGRGVG